LAWRRPCGPRRSRRGAGPALDVSVVGFRQRRQSTAKIRQRALARYLRVITASPRNLDALTGAGRAALQVGDAQAAIGFFARAEQISPKNGRVKAGLGSALVLLHQEQAALRYFDDATQLGVPEGGYRQRPRTGVRPARQHQARAAGLRHRAEARRR
jgi:tetratricopeptide (TPR) repeat protein